MPSAKIKVERHVVDGEQWVDYDLARGHSEVSGRGVVSKLGVVTLVGATYTELSGTVSVYIGTAWRGPIGVDGELVPDAEGRVKTSFSSMLAFMRFLVNRDGQCALGSAAVRFYNEGESFVLLGEEHRKQDGQAFTSLASGALVEFHRSWYNQTIRDEFCEQVSFLIE